MISVVNIWRFPRPEISPEYFVDKKMLAVCKYYRITLQ